MGRVKTDLSKSHIYILNGIATSGKSSFAQLCAEVKDSNVVVTELSMITYVKKLTEYMGIANRSKTKKYRVFLNDIKIAIDKYRPTWIWNTVVLDMEDIVNANPNAVHIFLINSREKSDHETIKEQGELLTGNPVKSILITRSGVETKTEVDSLVEDIQTAGYDIVIKNDGTLEDLQKEAEKFVKQN